VIVLKIKGRKVKIELENVSYDHDYWCDCYVSSAYDIELQKDLPEEELEQMSDSIDKIDWIMDYLY
jgi:hypothetical protein